MVENEIFKVDIHCMNIAQSLPLKHMSWTQLALALLFIEKERSQLEESFAFKVARPDVESDNNLTT